MSKFWLVVFSFFLFFMSASAQKIKVGIVSDYEKSKQLDSIVNLIIKQVDITLGVNKRVEFLNENFSTGNVTFNQSINNYKKISNATDIVLLIGGNTINAVATEKKITKPTFCIGVIDPKIQGIPYANGKSNLKNFSYIIPSNSFEDDLIEFKKVVPFNHLTILVNSGSVLSSSNKEAQESFNALKNRLNIAIDVIEVNKVSNNVLNSISPNSDAVYIADLYFLSDSEIRSLSNLLVEKKLPSFSRISKNVHNGIFASQSDESYFDILIRKLGVMVDDALSGQPLQTMDVKVTTNDNLIINEKTAKDLSIDIPFELLFTSKTVKGNQNTTVYSLENIIELVLKNNLDVAISQQDVLLAAQNSKLAQLALLPNLDLFVNARQINKENASAGFGQSEQLVSGKLQLDQVIYSQKAFSGIKIAKYYEKSQEYLTNYKIQESLVVVINDYLNVLTAKAILEIEKENLENFELNLTNAELQVKSGYLESSELYRWESEVAKAKQLVVEASINYSKYKVILNNQLAYSLDKEFDVKDIDIEDELFKRIKSGVISNFVTSFNDLNKVTEFLVSESKANNPNKKYIIEQLNALEQQRTLNKRLFYLPDISLQGQTNQILARGGVGSDLIAGSSNNNSWNIGIGLKFPIFSQYSRVTELNTTNIEIDRMKNSITKLDNELEMTVKNTILQAVTATTNIDFSKISAEKSFENFKLMQLRYNEGDVDVTRLIDAQRTYMQAKLNYELSIYDYIRNKMDVEFALGYFYFIAPEDKINEFKNRFLEYLKSTPNEK